MSEETENTSRDSAEDTSSSSSPDVSKANRGQPGSLRRINIDSIGPQDSNRSAYHTGGLGTRYRTQLPNGNKNLRSIVRKQHRRVGS